MSSQGMSMIRFASQFSRYRAVSAAGQSVRLNRGGPGISPPPSSASPGRLPAGRIGLTSATPCRLSRIFLFFLFIAV